VDFSYKRTVLSRMSQQARSLLVLDHHKTAAEDLADKGFEGYAVVFDMNKSGGRLAWEYLYDRRLFPEGIQDAEYSLHGAPWLVDYTEDRDLWRWRLPQSRTVNAALRSYPMTFASWDEFVSRSIANLALEGQSILRREQQIIDQHVQHAREIELDGHRVRCVNATVLFSEIAGELARDRPFGACYFDRQDGKRQWSLRSRDGGVDVSEIAKLHGGGGHRNAAGFEQEIDEVSYVHA